MCIEKCALDLRQLLFPGWVIIKEKMTFFTVSCSSYYCYVTDYSKTEGVKQPLLNFAHGFGPALLRGLLRWLAAGAINQTPVCGVSLVILK